MVREFHVIFEGNENFSPIQCYSIIKKAQIKGILRNVTGLRGFDEISRSAIQKAERASRLKKIIEEFERRKHHTQYLVSELKDIVRDAEEILEVKKLIESANNSN